MRRVSTYLAAIAVFALTREDCAALRTLHEAVIRVHHRYELQCEGAEKRMPGPSECKAILPVNILILDFRPLHSWTIKAARFEAETGNSIAVRMKL